MGVRKSKEVEPGGKVVGRLMDEWERKWQVSLVEGPATR
jgi:hypothetical protein